MKELIVDNFKNLKVWGNVYIQDDFVSGIGSQKNRNELGGMTIC